MTQLPDATVAGSTPPFQAPVAASQTGGPAAVESAGAPPVEATTVNSASLPAAPAAASKFGLPPPPHLSSLSEEL